MSVMFGWLRVRVRRVLSAMAQRNERWRMRQIEHEIATYLQSNGGRFTDEMERRIFDLESNGGRMSMRRRDWRG